MKASKPVCVLVVPPHAGKKVFALPPEEGESETHSFTNTLFQIKDASGPGVVMTGEELLALSAFVMSHVADQVHRGPVYFYTPKEDRE